MRTPEELKAAGYYPESMQRLPELSDEEKALVQWVLNIGTPNDWDEDHCAVKEVDTEGNVWIAKHPPYIETYDGLSDHVKVAIDNLRMLKPDYTCTELLFAIRTAEIENDLRGKASLGSSSWR